MMRMLRHAADYADAMLMLLLPALLSLLMPPHDAAAPRC